MNPASTYIPVARKDGVTTAVIAPGGANIVRGRSAVVDLNGESVADMLVRGPVAMYAVLGDGGEVRGEDYEHLRRILSDAKSFPLRKAAYDAGTLRTLSASGEDLAALGPVMAGTMPLVIAANKAIDIRAALGIAKQYGIKVIVEGAAEAWECAKELAAAHAMVMAGAMNNIPNSFSTLGHRQENLAILRSAGVNVILMADGGGFGEDNYNAGNIRYEAGNAVAYGMNWDDALKAVTWNPALAFGVADKVGSLQAGREADVVVWSGDPFEFATVAEHVYVRGVENLAKTRRDMLTDRYKHKPANYKQP
jgi:imidazolonepropionase-like amidohydrolase